jgi:hypothetical protein
MNKKLKAIIEDKEERGEGRMTRLLLSDDKIVEQRKGAGSTYSLVIAELVPKGLRYEALEKGAGDPVLRNLLRTVDQLVVHRLEESLLPLRTSLGQSQLFLATVFLTIAAKLNFPIQTSNPEALNDLTNACMPQANEMLTLIVRTLEDNQPLPPPE